MSLFCDLMKSALHSKACTAVYLIIASNYADSKLGCLQLVLYVYGTSKHFRLSWEIILDHCSLFGWTFFSHCLDVCAYLARKLCLLWTSDFGLGLVRWLKTNGWRYLLFHIDWARLVLRRVSRSHFAYHKWWHFLPFLSHSGEKLYLYHFRGQFYSFPSNYCRGMNRKQLCLWCAWTRAAESYFILP